MSSEVRMDRIDFKILNVLQSQARITNQELAEKIGLSPSSCLNRVRKLEEMGVLGPYLSVINLHKFCRSITCITTVTMKNHTQESFRTFERFILSIPEIVECYTVSGAFDFFLKIICTDMQRYLELNEALLNSGANVVNLSTHVVMNENKRFVGYPLDKLV